MEDYNRHKESESTASLEKDTKSQSFVDQARTYSEMLARGRVVEEQSMRRLEEWNVFRGVMRADVCSAAETVVKDGRLQMRDRWSSLLRMFARESDEVDAVRESKVSIISLNWSATFIRQCLLRALQLRPDDQAGLARFIEKEVQIHSCEIAGLDEPEGSSGRMQASVLSSADKLKYMPRASRRRTPIHPDRTPDPEAPYLVYVGDSSTDFDCLTTADTGIWLYPATSQEEAETRCSQFFRPLQLRLRPIRDAGQEGVGQEELVWAQDFEQIAAFLSNLAP